MGKVLIIRGGAVGDFILTLPAIHALRETLPEGVIEVLGYDSITAIAKASGMVQGTRSMEYGPLSAFFVPGGELPKDLVDYFASFSVVISYLYDPDEYFHTNLEKAGVKTLLRGPYQIKEAKDAAHASDQLLSPLESLAIYPDESRTFSLQFEQSINETASGLLSSDSNRNTIAIHPGSGSPRKNWSFEGWVDSLSKIHSDFPETNFAVISGEAEHQTIAEFHALLEKADLPWRRIADQSLPVVGAAIQQCVAYLGHDTGISHLAGACGTPSLLLFGPTDPAIWAPPHPKVSVLKGEGNNLSRIQSKTLAEKVAAMLGDD